MSGQRGRLPCIGRCRRCARVLRSGVCDAGASRRVREAAGRAWGQTPTTARRSGRWLRRQRRRPALHDGSGRGVEDGPLVATVDLALDSHTCTSSVASTVRANGKGENHTRPFISRAHLHVCLWYNTCTNTHSNGRHQATGRFRNPFVSPKTHVSLTCCQTTIRSTSYRHLCVP